MSAATSVLLFMTFVITVAGMCFENTKSSPPREIVKPAHTVGSIEGCKAACWSSAACHAFSYNSISCMCVHLGALREGTCAGKGFYPYVKCADTVDCEYLMAKSGVISAFPRCQVKSNFFKAFKVSAPKVCDAPPSEIICEQNQCFCKNPNQQLVIKYGSSHSCSVKAYCDEGNTYRLTSPNGNMFLLLNMSASLCTTIDRTSYEKCMCDLPLVLHGVRNGNKLCGHKKISRWGDVEQKVFTTNLTCTPDGWSDGVKIVKPEYVFCESK